MPYLTRRNARIQSTIIGMHRRNVQMRFDVAIGGASSDLEAFSAGQLLSVQEPGDLRSWVSGSHALEPEEGARAKGLLAEAVADLGGLD